MRHRNFRHTESMNTRQGWNHSVQLTEKLHVLNDFVPIALEPAIVVVPRHSAEVTEHLVENAAWQHFVPRVMTYLFPSAYEIESLVKLRKKSWNFSRIVLQVGVHREYDLTAARIKSGLQPSGFSAITAEANADDLTWV